MTPSTAHRSRARTRSSIPRRVSGPAARGGAVALPAPRRGTTGIFERLSRLPDHAVVDRLLRGRSWIWLIGVALGGIVAMQVSLLKLNTGISRAVEASATLERQNAGLEADIAKLSSGERIQAGARKTGMVQPPAGSVNYLTARPGADAHRAARTMKPPSPEAKQLIAQLGPPAAAGAAPTASQGATGAAPGAQGPAPGTEDTAPATGPAPGTAGAAPGTQAAAPDATGTTPGTQGAAPGTTGTAPDAAGAAPGTGTTPGTQGAAPGTTGAAPAQQDAPTTGTAPDATGTTPGTQGATGGAQTGAAGGVAAGQG